MGISRRMGIIFGQHSGIFPRNRKVNNAERGINPNLLYVNPRVNRTHKGLLFNPANISQKIEKRCARAMYRSSINENWYPSNRSLLSWASEEIPAAPLFTGRYYIDFGGKIWKESNISSFLIHSFLKPLIVVWRVASWNIIWSNFINNNKHTFSHFYLLLLLLLYSMDPSTYRSTTQSSSALKLLSCRLFYLNFSLSKMFL